MSQFWSPLVHRLTPYLPGEQPKVSGLIKLNTNENPYPPSPRVIRAIQAELADDAASLRRYPDPTSEFFREAVVRQFANDKITLAQVFAGNGSDEVLALAFQALLKHEKYDQPDKPILMPDISYSFYPVYCGLYDIDYQTIPLNDNFEIKVDDYLQENGGIIIANPNAPTGVALPLKEIERLVATDPKSVVVLDEAYVDFGAETAAKLIHDYPNLLVVRTLSKSHALAGLRVGYALGHPALIEALERVKNSFNSYPLDRLAIVGGAAALGDSAYLEETRQAIMKTRRELVAQLEILAFSVLPSSANFIFARHAFLDAAKIAQKLREQKIIVRHFKQARIDQYLRISIGTDDECQALLEAMRAIVLAGK